ncbi:YfhO family protein [Flavobacterium ardleyense]|uniref:YfhO family protein n=1 Tax=Flavobacterium ardleyense TaxID=2038737 RepID=UPI00298C433C|nr:YfhO family protein [Flavobacterium ardleyense]
MKSISKFYPHLAAIAGFIIIALLYFYPVLQGKQIFQSDIVQYTGMAKEQNDFRASENQEPFWTNSAFGGMPTYQLGANYPHNYVKKLDSIIRFLPRPADYLFLYFIGFYVLLIVLKINPLKAFIGALAFGLSTYMVIILGVGHNAKAHAIGYMPLVLAGVLLVYRKRYILGGLLTMVAAALEINANHFQMTYYLLFLLLIIGIYYTYIFIKEKDFKTLGFTLATFGIAAIFAIGSNATGLLATAEYADFSMRAKSELTFNPDGSKNTTTAAMDYGYITEYSYGLAESFNLIAPRLFGGSNSEKLGEDSDVYDYLIGAGASEGQAREFISGLPTYWGDQPIVAAPAYIGAIVFFLAVLAFFVDNKKIKYLLLAGALLSLILSWGKNFALVTDFFIHYVPFYDKFRAVSSIQVILELCMPAIAIIGLSAYFKEEDEAKRWNALWKTTAISLGLILFLFLIKGFFNFNGSNDGAYAQNFGPDFVSALKNDRKTMYSADLLRSGFFIIVAGLILYLHSLKRFSQTTAVILVGVFMIADLFFVDKKYVDSSSFVAARQVEEPFQPTAADLEILKDTSHYRVFEVQGRLKARTSYFHKSLSGYSAVRPRRIEQLFDYQIAKNNFEILNMLNTKYVIQVDEKGQEFPAVNPDANGNAWFVSKVNKVTTADQEMKALDEFNSLEEAIVNTSEFPSLKSSNFSKDSLAKIELQVYKPNYLKYTSNNANNGLAVFSEIYYPQGWQARIDGKEVDHIRVDYTLRALEIPKGNHTIEFSFEPQVVKTGSMISLVSSLGILLLIVGGIYYEFFFRKEESDTFEETE